MQITNYTHVKILKKSTPGLINIKSCVSSLNKIKEIAFLTNFGWWNDSETVEQQNLL